MRSLVVISSASGNREVIELEQQLQYNNRRGNHNRNNLLDMFITMAFGVIASGLMVDLIRLLSLGSFLSQFLTYYFACCFD